MRDEVVVQAHDLEVGVLGGLGDADVVVEALAHALYAVSAYKDRHEQALLWLLSHHGLKLSAEEQVELLVRAAELDIGLNDCGVVSLEEWVEELGDGDGPVGLEAIGEVLTGEDLSDGEAAGEGYDLGEGEVAEPLALPSDVGAVTVYDLEELVHVGLGVFADGLGGEHLPGGGLATGVADLGCPVADYEDYAVAELLELAQLAEPYGMAEVDVGAAGIEPHLESERFTGIEELL